jgi:di/tricarboxylate transporter
MTLSQIILIVIVAIPVTLTISGRLRVDVSALLIAAGLGIAQSVGLNILGPAGHPEYAKNAISGFGQPVVITLLALFGLTRSLDKTGVTHWLASRILQLGGQSERRLIVLFTSTAAALSLFMNNLAAGALLLPSAMDAARRTKIAPSKLLIPVAYGTLLGGAATYFTTANIIVSGLLPVVDPSLKPLGVFDFTPVGGIMALVGIVYMAVFAPRLLPNRESASQSIQRPTGPELENAYQLGERLWEARIQTKSGLIGKTLGTSGIGEQLGVTVVAIWHGRQAILSPTVDQVLAVDDILLIAGREDRVTQLIARGLVIGRETNGASISARGVSLLEVMLAPHSHIEGRTLKEIEFRKQYNLTAVALWRNGRSYRTDVADFKLQLGDSFLMIGPTAHWNKIKNSADFIVLEPDTSDRPINRRNMLITVGVTVTAVIASVFGVSTFLAMLVAALVLVLTDVLPMNELYQAVEWRAIFLIAGMYSVSIAMTSTGLADLVGKNTNQFVSSPLGLAATAFWITAILSQIIGGQVVALVTGPIAISAAFAMHPNSQLPQAIAVVTAIACSASFLTPVAHPVNVLMIGPGNYRVSDFFRVGLGLTVVCFITVMLVLPIFWQL